VDQSPLEDIFCGAKFDASAGTKKLPEYAVRYYIDTLTSHPEALHSSFGFYCAADTSTPPNEKCKTLPVLAIGGAESFGNRVGNAMKLAADDVQTLVIPDCGQLGRRAGSRRTARGADRLPGSVPGRADRSHGGRDRRPQPLRAHESSCPGAALIRRG
jgi:hypothetical protein